MRRRLASEELFPAISVCEIETTAIYLTEIRIRQVLRKSLADGVLPGGGFCLRLQHNKCAEAQTHP